MRISTRGRYGLKAMIDLAVNSENESCVCLKSIAERQNISENYLEQLMAALKKADFVKSIRGAQGGYILNKNPNNISVGDLLRVLEGSINVVDCESNRKNESCTTESCSKCVTKTVWEKINDSIAEAADSITLAELVSDYKNINKEM